jgi:GNAT superfamily N-acetyltransferase
VIRLCHQRDIDRIHAIINDSARAYEGHIPEDCYHEPYMPKDKLLSEIADGVVFYGYEDDGLLVAVMGLQDKGPVILIRHAYTSTEKRGKGIGSSLLEYLLEMTAKPVLVGTWQDAKWAIRFYEKHGFRLANKEQKDRLLREYWSIPERQVETSVVLVDEGYRGEVEGTERQANVDTNDQNLELAE